jgi:hypothetical protein
MADNARGRNNWIGGGKQQNQADATVLRTSIVTDHFAGSAIHKTRYYRVPLPDILVLFCWAQRGRHNPIPKFDDAPSRYRK